MDLMEEVEATCPSCSPVEAVPHAVVKGNLLKCGQCGNVHRLPRGKKTEIRLRVIVSRGGESSVQYLDVDAGEELHSGDEFVVDAGGEVSGVRVQSLELLTGGRSECAKANAVRAIWARAIDEVIVKIAVQRLGETKSLDYKVGGDYEFAVGDVMKLKGYEVRVSGIKVRDGGIYRREGRAVKAKDVRRVYSKIIAEERRAVGEGLRPSRKRRGGSGGKP